MLESDKLFLKIQVVLGKLRTEQQWLSFCSQNHLLFSNRVVTLNSTGMCTSSVYALGHWSQLYL